MLTLGLCLTEGCGCHDSRRMAHVLNRVKIPHLSNPQTMTKDDYLQVQHHWLSSLRPFTVPCAREHGDTEFTVRLQSQPGGCPFPICEEKENSISQVLSQENSELLKGHAQFLNTNGINTKCHHQHVQSMLLGWLEGTREISESIT